MKTDFWLERWERQEIGFHQDEINPHLVQHWKELSLTPGATVFVPLCGKSRDMLWLRRQGHVVRGVEISPIAAQAFFEENGYVPSHLVGGKHEHYEADDVRISCGDFFDLSRDDLKEVAAVYDRASLVALPPEMRERYADHLAEILPAGAKMLLLTFDYPQAEMPGPPFAVSPREVAALYGDRATVRLLAEHDTLAQNPRFQERGLSRLREGVFLVTFD